jgi:hypothetical protein
MTTKTEPIDTACFSHAILLFELARRATGHCAVLTEDQLLELFTFRTGRPYHSNLVWYSAQTLASWEALNDDNSMPTERIPLVKPAERWLCQRYISVGRFDVDLHVSHEGFGVALGNSYWDHDNVTHRVLAYLAGHIRGGASVKVNRSVSKSLSATCGVTVEFADQLHTGVLAHSQTSFHVGKWWT